MATISNKKWMALIPVIFVFLWSTGVIAAKFGLPYIEPFYLLFIRMLFTVIIFLGLMWWFKAPKLTITQTKHQIVTGILLHSCYLGGLYLAVKLQMPAGISGLLVSLQPLLTVLFLMNKISITKQQWFGILLGLLGVAIVLYGRGLLPGFILTLPMLLAISMALLGITLGSLYQKRFSSEVNLLSASTTQYVVTLILMGGLTLLFENHTVDWQWTLIGSILWQVLALSVLAILLLLHMIRNGAAEKVASYFYLVPGVTALQAWLFFEEQFPLIAIAGFTLSLIGVYFTVKPQPNH